MNDPWTWTMVWRLTLGEGMGWAEKGKGGKIGTTNRINKNKKRNIKQNKQSYIGLFAKEIIFPTQTLRH